MKLSQLPTHCSAADFLQNLSGHDQDATGRSAGTMATQNTIWFSKEKVDSAGNLLA